MKFLAFNILVGAALAWLVFGRGEVPTVLASMLPISASAQAMPAACPSHPAATEMEQVEVKKPSITTVTGKGEGGALSRRLAPKAGQEVLASVEIDRPGLKLNIEPKVSRSMDQPDVNATQPDPEVVPSPGQPAEQRSRGRRDALLSLAENMELFSVERIVK
jgi:hypothetical protein